MYLCVVYVCMRVRFMYFWDRQVRPEYARIHKCSHIRSYVRIYVCVYMCIHLIALPNFIVILQITCTFSIVTDTKCLDFMIYIQNVLILCLDFMTDATQNRYERHESNAKQRHEQPFAKKPKTNMRNSTVQCSLSKKRKK
jgi:hypothetical protein